MDQNEVEGKLQKGAGRVQSAMGDLTGDSKSQAEGAARQVAGKVQDTYGRVVDAVSGARDNMNEVGGQLLDQLDDFGGTLAQQIEERPFASILIAGAVGYLLALMTTRR